VDQSEIRETFDRELYRHSDPVRTESGTPGDVAEAPERLRRRLEEMAQELQRDAGQAAPWDDPSLTSSRGIRGKYKLAIHRILRPVSRRYDRITGELARACAELADLLIQSQDDARRLRQEMAVLEERVRALSAGSGAAAANATSEDES
jgi:hypothetical protein